MYISNAARTRTTKPPIAMPTMAPVESGCGWLLFPLSLCPVDDGRDPPDVVEGSSFSSGKNSPGLSAAVAF